LNNTFYHRIIDWAQLERGGVRKRRGTITAATDCYIEYLIWIERLQLTGGGGMAWRQLGSRHFGTYLNSGVISLNLVINCKHFASNNWD